MVASDAGGGVTVSQTPDSTTFTRSLTAVFTGSDRCSVWISEASSEIFVEVSRGALAVSFGSVSVEDSAAVAVRVVSIFSPPWDASVRLGFFVFFFFFLD